VTTGRETSLDPAALAARIGQAVADAIAPIVVDALESARREPTTSDTRTQGSPLCDLPPVFGFLELQRALGSGAARGPTLQASGASCPVHPGQRRGLADRSPAAPVALRH
jgi:hypothetical protein